MQFRLTKILDLFAVPFHILLIKLLSLLLVNLISRSINPNTSQSNDFGRRHPNITTHYNIHRRPDFHRSSESSNSVAEKEKNPHSSLEKFYENTRSTPG